MQSLSRAIKKLFGIQYLLCFLVLLLEMSFAQLLSAGTVSELDLGLTAKGASPLPAAEALRAKMAEELDLGVGHDLIPKSGGGGGGGGGGRGRGGWSRSLAVAQEDLRKHEAAEEADQAATDREMAEAEAMIADAERDMGGRVRSRGSRSKPAVGNQTQNVVPGLTDPAEDPHVGAGTGGSARSRQSRFTYGGNRQHNPEEGRHDAPGWGQEPPRGLLTPARRITPWRRTPPPPQSEAGRLVDLIRERTEIDIDIGLGEQRIADLQRAMEEEGWKQDEEVEIRKERERTLIDEAKRDPDFARRDPTLIIQLISNTMETELITNVKAPVLSATTQGMIDAYTSELNALKARLRELDLELKKRGIIPLQ